MALERVKEVRRSAALSALESLPEAVLEHCVRFVVSGEAICFALTSTRILAAVQKATAIAIVPRGDPEYFLSTRALFRYAIESLQQTPGLVGPMHRLQWMHCAVKWGMMPQVKVLRALEPPCAWDTATCEHAVEQGDVSMIEWLRGQQPPCPCNFECCFEVARCKGHKELEQYFRRGLELLEVLQGDRLDEAQDLIALGADANASDEHGRNALSYACADGHIPIVTLLLAAGADVHTEDSAERTPLHLACTFGHKDIARMLLEKGADVHAVTGDGETTLLLACENGHAEVAMVLLEEGVDVNSADDEGYTPLHWACFECLAEVVVALLEKGADIDAKDGYQGHSPLNCACAEGHTEVVMVLLEKGADIHAKDSDGYTPLHWACVNGCTEVAVALLEKGADLHAEASNGLTPLKCACSKGLAEVLMDIKTLMDRSTAASSESNS